MNMIHIKEHINQDHKQYASYDNERNIPHIADGLKPSQRKIIYTVLKTLAAGKEIKVANLGSRASDISHYQHGESSIIDAVIGMAQDFTGSNNIPWLQKEGQFGNIMSYEASEPRYIFVKKGQNLERLISAKDDAILNEQTFDGDEIEPEFYLPCLPMILVNGGRGVGNGYNSRILNRPVKDVKKAIEAILAGKEVKNLKPGWDGFKGTVEGSGKSWVVTGSFERVNSTTIRITSLPPDSTFQYENYKNRVLLKLLDNKDINSFQDNSTEDGWDILIKAPRVWVSQDDEVITKALGLVWRISETTTCWNWAGKIGMYEDAVAILKDWIEGRIIYMAKRKKVMVTQLCEEIRWLQAKKGFIQYWNSKPSELVKLNKVDLFSDIKTALGFDDSTINKLLGLRISSLTMDDINGLIDDIANKDAEIAAINNTTEAQMLLKDIKAV